VSVDFCVFLWPAQQQMYLYLGCICYLPFAPPLAAMHLFAGRVFIVLPLTIVEGEETLEHRMSNDCRPGIPRNGRPSPFSDCLRAA